MAGDNAVGFAGAQQHSGQRINDCRHSRQSRSDERAGEENLFLMK
jgi:hypothetical protein